MKIEEIRVKGNENGIYEIWVNNILTGTLWEVCFDDPSVMGEAIILACNSVIPLDREKYNKILLLFRDVIGIQHYGKKKAYGKNMELTVETTIGTKENKYGKEPFTTNIINIYAGRRFDCVEAGGFIIEESTDYIINNSESIINKIKALGKVMANEKKSQ